MDVGPAEVYLGESLMPTYGNLMANLQGDYESCIVGKHGAQVGRIHGNAVTANTNMEERVKE
jgi:hypothetical protein